MRGVSSVVDEFSEFVQDASRGVTLGRVASLANGFEGWLKIEFLLWFLGRGFTLNEDVGVEYKFKTQADTGTGIFQKQCDLWVRSSDLSRFHYVEFKAPFANHNRVKMINSAAYDFRCLARMEHGYEEAASGAVIVVGNGFGDTDWGMLLDTFVTGALIDKMKVSRHDSGPSSRLRWVGWTHTYP